MSEWSTKQHGTLPAEIIDRFRLASVERIERLEALWSKLTADPNDADTINAIDREVHTLKGESRMVGFTDVDMVAHKLEDVLDVARDRSFQITDDLDLVVTMAFRFMAMLIRKKAGQTLGGIDLPGFVRQIDAVIRETQSMHPLRGRMQTSPLAKGLDGPLFSTTVRDRLAGVGLDLFLELIGGHDSRRIRRGWKQMRDTLAPPDHEPIAPVLAKHETGARELIADLAKEVAVRFDLQDEARTSPAVVAALDVATLHLLRNAIDHGIEPPDERVAAGKPRRGRIAVRCSMDHDRVTLEVEDDGHGIDFAQIKRQGVALGLVAADAMPSDNELSQLLLHPGFTTRKTATQVSGRGIGLDAVHGQVVALGGTVDVRSQLGAGTAWTVTIPSPARRFRVRRFAVRGTQVPFAVPSDWEIELAPTTEQAVDLVEELGIGTPGGNPIALQLTRGDSTVRVGAASEPQETEARWLVTTSAETLASVISIDGVECLLLRPDLLVMMSGKVAIVDDSEIVRETVAFTLKPYGIDVLTFADPKPLIGTLAVKPVDLVLLDLSFKGLDVKDLIRRIKQALPDCVVYLHSDRTPIELARIAEQSKADGHLAKAAGREQFISRVLRILRSKRQEKTS